MTEISNKKRFDQNRQRDLNILYMYIHTETLIILLKSLITNL